MKRPEVKAKGYRWSEFDQEVAAFLRALNPNPGAPHHLAQGYGRVSLDPNMATFANAIFAANTSSPSRFLVTLLVECVLNEAAERTDVQYVDTVRPFLVITDGFLNLQAPVGFLRRFFAGRGPGLRSLTDATTHLSLDWASRNWAIFGPSFVERVLGALSHEDPPDNPFRAGFEKALSDFKKNIEDIERD